MEQNINLITTVNVQPISFFDAKLIAQVLGGWIILLMLIYAIAFSLTSPKQKTITQLEANKKNLQTQRENLKKELASFATTDKIKNLQTLPFTSTNSTGFSDHLEDLAKLTPNGIWFTDIILSQPDGLILLKGNAIAAAEIPLLIEALDESKNLHDKKLGTLQIQKNPKNDNISFTLGTITSTTKDKNESAIH